MRMLAAALLLIPGVAQATPVGMSSHVAGKAEVRTGAAGAWKPLKFMQQLESGDSVRCAPGAEAVVVLFENGGRYKIGGGGTGVLEKGNVRGGQRATAMPGRAVQIARAMTGSRADAFMARPAQSHQRLTPQFPGWLPEGERKFEWTPITGAASYTFSLFDTNDNVVWSTRVTDPRAEYPAELPYFALRRPYLWRLAAFSKSGKPLPESRWGLLAFLAPADSDQLRADAQALQPLTTDPNDATGFVLLAGLYRSYGVLEPALEILENPQLVKQPGLLEAQGELYRDAGRLAQLWRGGQPQPR